MILILPNISKEYILLKAFYFFFNLRETNQFLVQAVLLLRRAYICAKIAQSLINYRMLLTF